MHRTIVIKNCSKLRYLLGYLIIYDGEKETRVFLKEISVLIIESTNVVITMPLLIELTNSNVALIYCDEKHNPVGTLLGLNNNYQASGNLFKQLKWTKTRTSLLWKEIVRMKIANQVKVLELLSLDIPSQLIKYIDEVHLNDATNREGLAAKMHFSVLFESGFNRSDSTHINYLLDYGYSVILSCFNREIAVCGYNNQLGIWHKGKTNPFNLSSDFMEPFRPLIDLFVYLYSNNENPLSPIRRIPTMKILLDDVERYVDDAIGVYVRSLIRFLNNETSVLPVIKFKEVSFYETIKSYENNSNV
ncbi:MAG: type II CRISPR-associated endonuclease Cas1 [Erysipelotrichaceae bacterium]|jgi:CRISPR-associated endonuclease Cas1 subtype II|nr:type II CRISPR-associated endonuclease Cas1 [Erysipelotrichaceae bacterium]